MFVDSSAVNRRENVEQKERGCRGGSRHHLNVHRVRHSTTGNHVVQTSSNESNERRERRTMPSGDRYRY